MKAGLIAPMIAPMMALISCAPYQDKSASIVDTRAIVGGIPVEEDSDISASAVLIIANQAPKAGAEICTGTLIATNLILTAAHCVLTDDDPSSPIPPQQIALYFGNAQVIYVNNERSVTNAHAQKQASKVVVHEKHIGHFHDPDINDIALIQFKGDLPQGLKPASILPASQSDVPLHYRTQVEVAGFGITENGETPVQRNLRQTSLVTISDSGDSIFKLTSSQFEDRSTCDGDSGGPSYVYIDDKPNLWAVNIESNCRSLTWVLNLADYHHWIKKKASELKSKSPTFEAKVR